MHIIDCHNHSLPEIDDGAIDTKMSLEMLKIAESNGTTDIILTPHHLNGAFNNFSAAVIEKTEFLREEAIKNGISLNLHYGSEVHITPETVEHIIEHKTLTYCGLGKAALLELPKNSIPVGTESILSELIYHGITPIIAHPERNSALRKDHAPLKEWIEFGCKSQLTGQSCNGRFGQSLQEFSFRLITENLVHFVASDAHRPEGRNPNLTSAVDTLTDIFGENVARTLFQKNPAKLINGDDIANLDIVATTLPANQSKFRSKKKRDNKRWFKLFS